MKSARARCLILLSILSLLLLLSACEVDPVKTDAETTAAVTEESSEPEAETDETNGETDDAIPNLPEDGFTKIY